MCRSFPTWHVGYVLTMPNSVAMNESQVNVVVKELLSSLYEIGMAAPHAEGVSDICWDDNSPERGT